MSKRPGESNIGVEEPCNKCAEPSQWELIYPDLPSDAIIGQTLDGRPKVNVRRVNGPHSKQPGTAHWCNDCDVKSPTGEICGMRIRQVHATAKRKAYHTLASGKGVKEHRCKWMEKQKQHRGTDFHEQRAPKSTRESPESIDKFVEQVATGKAPAPNEYQTPPTHKGEKAVFKTADKLLKKVDEMVKTGDLPDNELADRMEKASIGSPVEYEGITKENIELKSTLASHNKLTGEAIDALTKKLADTIGRVEKLESILGKLGDKSLHLDRLDDNIARLHNWIREVKEAVNTFPDGVQP